MRRLKLASLCLLGVVVILLAIILLLPVRQPSSPTSVEAADGNSANPYREELDCYDQVLATNELGPESVQPALARCRALGPAAPANDILDDEVNLTANPAGNSH